MADLKYNFGGFFPQLRAEGSDAQLTVGEYQSFISLTVFNNSQVAIRIPINRYAHFKMKQSFAAIQKAAPNTRIVALNTTEWDSQTRTHVFKNSIILGKTEDGQFYMELKDQNSAPLKFVFKWPATITAGSDPIDDATKGLEALTVWKEMWERDIPNMMFHARFNFIPPRRKGSSNSNKSTTSTPSSSEEDELY